MSNKACVTAAYGDGIGPVKTENLRTFHGKPGYALAQGQ